MNPPKHSHDESSSTFFCCGEAHHRHHLLPATRAAFRPAGLLLLLPLLLALAAAPAAADFPVKNITLDDGRDMRVTLEAPQSAWCDPPAGEGFPLPPGVSQTPWFQPPFYPGKMAQEVASKVADVMCGDASPMKNPFFVFNLTREDGNGAGDFLSRVLYFVVYTCSNGAGDLTPIQVSHAELCGPDLAAKPWPVLINLPPVVVPGAPTSFTAYKNAVLQDFGGLFVDDQDGFYFVGDSNVGATASPARPFG
jgi:hypothetical protein